MDISQVELDSTQACLVRVAVHGDTHSVCSAGRRAVGWDEVLTATGLPHDVLAKLHPHLVHNIRIVPPHRRRSASPPVPVRSVSPQGCELR